MGVGAAGSGAVHGAGRGHVRLRVPLAHGAVRHRACAEGRAAAQDGRHGHRLPPDRRDVRLRGVRQVLARTCAAITKEPRAASLLAYHNIRHQMRLCADMHDAILGGRFGAFAREYVRGQFPDSKAIPGWVREAIPHGGGFRSVTDKKGRPFLRGVAGAV